MVPPQPSETVPQVVPHCCGVHPQTLAAPLPPQVLKPVQVPQFNVPPQPSDTIPHVARKDAHVNGVQVTGTQRPAASPGHV
jgi:hypothetical protein